MKRFTSVASMFALALVVLALPAIASAQYSNRDRDDDYYNRNNRNDDYYGNGNGNGNGRYNRNIRGTIQNLKNRARNFESRLDHGDVSLGDDRHRQRIRADPLGADGRHQLRRLTRCRPRAMSRARRRR